ncbi:unnamed protein product [Mytilus coruscus]|uniref:Uncharacterized protein n=1 Tax=Mytilus coruscus TaxID=42192 RepID=A0A6J8D6E5_MYTCO|nr:unnamed protein product [Mytilus coruscus]
MDSLLKEGRAQRARADGISQEDRLEGFIWKTEDWHAHVISLQVRISIELRNLFEHRGVKSEVKDAVNSCRDFLRFVTQGDGKCRQNHRGICPYRHLTDLRYLMFWSLDLDQQSTSNQSEEKQEKPDYKFNYSCCLLREGLKTGSEKIHQRRTIGRG